MSTPTPDDTRAPGSLRRLGQVVLVVATLALGKAAVTQLPGAAHAERPFVVSGAFGDPVSLRTGTVRLVRVTGATTIDTGLELADSPGRWLVLTYEFTPSSSTESVSGVSVRSGDRRWEAGRSRNTNDCRPVPAGVTTTCVAVLEVPAEDLPGAVLELTPVRERTGLDSVAQIELGLDEATVQSWDKTEVRVPTAHLGAELEAGR